MERYVIIIGAMKSGTTTLYEMLATHPQIAPITPKEPGFFAFEDIYAKGFEWFHSLSQFDPARHTYRLEASTDYTKAPFVTDVWTRMQARPNAQYKLIYIMRDPLKRMESHVRHVQGARKEIGQTISPRLDHGLDNGVSLEALSTGFYALQLDAYAQARAAGDLYVTTLEQLKTDPAPVMAEIYTFLDLPPQAAAPQKERHNAGIKARNVRTVWAKIGSHPLLIALGRVLLSEGMKAKIKSKYRKDTELTGRFALSAPEAEALRAVYAKDLSRLEAEYGIDVARHWPNSAPRS